MECINSIIWLIVIALIGVLGLIIYGSLTNKPELPTRMSENSWETPRHIKKSVTDADVKSLSAKLEEKKLKRNSAASYASTTTLPIFDDVTKDYTPPPVTDDMLNAANIYEGPSFDGFDGGSIGGSGASGSGSDYSSSSSSYDSGSSSSSDSSSCDSSSSSSSDSGGCD